MAGSLKRANASLPEDVVLIQSLHSSNVPKFLAEDIPLFLGLLSDLFPGVSLPGAHQGELEQAITYALARDGLQPVESFVTKVISGLIAIITDVCVRSYNYTPL